MRIIAFIHRCLVSSSSQSELPSSAPIDLEQVRRQFSRPARIVDSNFLRREVSSRMHERLELIKINPSHVLDAGCGDGADLAMLQQAFGDALTLGLDAAPAMLEKAGGEQSSARSTLSSVMSQWFNRTPTHKLSAAPELICGDFSDMPFARNAFDLIWSNLALHWHPQPQRVFAEWRRVLRTDGLLMFSCLGPDTFKEVRNAFAVVDDAPHALPFIDMHDFGDMLVEAGFSTPVMDMETLTVTYESVEKLLDEVRAWGGNPLSTRRRGLIGRQAWSKMLTVLESKRQHDGRLPLTYEIIYGHAFLPAPRTNASGESIIRFEPRKR